MIFATTPHDPELASAIWATYKPTLEEKHGRAGAMGKRGEEQAAVILASLFPEAKAIINHEDCLHQLLGIDITVLNHDGSSVFIDVKTGSSNLYWTSEKGWYITIKPSFFDARKKTEHIMHMGPKGDVFACYDRRSMMQFFVDKKIPLCYDFEIPVRHWPNFVITNLR